jgi:hypothetical protein
MRKNADVAYPIALTSSGTGLRALVQLAEFLEKLQIKPSLGANSIHTICNRPL